MDFVSDPRRINWVSLKACIDLCPHGSKLLLTVGHKNYYKKCDSLETYSIEQVMVGSFRWHKKYGQHAVSYLS